jgi:predicted transposase YdaD
MSGKTPHDNLFRLAFSQVPHATAHFRATLPPAVVEKVRWETLQLQPGSFVDPELQHLQSDVLWRARLRDEGDAFFYVLLEHQSRPDALMSFRLLRYMVRIWERWLLHTKNQRPLPFIVPMVLYNGDRSWNVSLAFEDLLPETLRAELHPFVPAFVYALQDLSQTLDEDLRGEPFRELVLLWLKYARHKDFWQRLPTFLPVLQQVDPQRELEPLMRYLFYATAQPMPEQVRLLLATELGAEVERWWMGWAQTVREEGLQQGREEGQQQERQRLLAKLRRQLLLSLQGRFGELPPHVTERVQAASEDELDRLSERLPTAQTLAELLE